MNKQENRSADGRWLTVGKGNGLPLAARKRISKKLLGLAVADPNQGTAGITVATTTIRNISEKTR